MWEYKYISMSSVLISIQLLHCAASQPPAIPLGSSRSTRPLRNTQRR